MTSNISMFKMRYFSSSYDELFSRLMPYQYEPSPPPVFIMGSGRNGSTLLTCMLNNHLQICIPPEHRFLPDAIRYWYTHPHHSWSKKVDHLCSLLEKPSLWKIDPLQIRREIENARTKPEYLASIIQIIYSNFGKSQGKSNPVWGDKTPGNTPFIKMIKRQFPAAKVIFMTRDPRDMIASCLKMNEDFFEKRIDFMLWRWKNSLEKYEDMKRRFHTDIKLLKYDELVGNPRKEVDEIVNWLGLEAQDDLLIDYGKNLKFLGLEKEPHHQNAQKPITTNSIGRWKTALPRSLSQKIEKQCGQHMVKYNYL